MGSFKPDIKTVLVIYLSFYLAFMPMAAWGGPLNPDGTTQTTVDQAANGVPVVNIANPNASGLSHNKFTDYNVNANGLILNNAATTTVNTQLGGYIFGNPQLSGSASVILNEVTGANRSILAGFTEVAGPQADLVIANPNGLTINGAGFINTSNVTLTTGRPMISNGVLSSLNITGGDISIEGAGLNMLGQSSTHIYTQHLNLLAALHANNLDIKLGSNSIDYSTGGIISSGLAPNANLFLLDSSALGGMYANRISLVGTGKGLGVNLPPAVLASAGNITITNDGDISMQQASASQQVNIQSNSGNINLSKNVYGGSNVAMTAAGGVTATAGTVAARNTVSVSSSRLNNQATIVAGLNPDGSQNATGSVSITSASVVNGGRIQSTGNLAINAATAVDNRNGQITALGNADLRTAALDNGGGSVEAGGNLSLTSNSANLANSTLYAGNDATLALDSLNNVSTSSLSANRNLTITAINAITNSADLLANGNMTLSAGGAVVNNKTISSGGALQINAGSLTNSAAGTIAGGTGSSSLNITGNIDNASRISAAGDLNVTGANITNNGFFNAGNNLIVSSSNLTNNATVFAGNNMELYTTGILANNPGANIFAMSNVTLAANAAMAMTSSIINNRGHIEAYGGDMNISAVNLTNKTNPPVVQGTYVPYKPAVPAKPGQVLPKPNGGRGAIYIPPVPAQPAVLQHIVGGATVSNTTVTNGCGFNCQNVVNTKVDQMVLKSASAPATIGAGGNLTLNATNITNQYSMISSGGNMQLSSQVVDNQPVNIMQVTTVKTDMYRNATVCNSFNFFGWCVGGWKNVMAYAGTTTNASTSVANTVSSTIQAGGSITGNAANLNNGNIKQNQTIAASSIQSQNTSVTANTRAPNIAAAIVLPAGNNGLFVASTNPKGSYLIETNPAFAVYGNFISSNYLLSRLNYASDTTTLKRLGDAFYEQKLIRDSIFAQTGRRYLNSSLRSDNAQYQFLMDNALKAQEELQLVPGIALTAAQVAMLNRDIVWIEEQQVAGQRVLVPVVYIAASHQYKIEGGSIIAGDDINLVVDELNNSGLLQAGRNMDIEAGDTITNSGGTIQADGKVKLLAHNDIENISAKIKGSDVALVSTDGSIINARLAEELALQGGRDSKTMVGEAASIEATGALALNAKEKIEIRGSSLKGEDVSLDAAQIDIGTTEVRSSFSGGNATTQISRESLTHLGSSVEGGNVSIASSGSTTVEGSDIAARENLDVRAGQLDVMAVNDYSYEETTTSKKGFLKKSTTTTKKATSTNVGSSLSGGNVALSSSEGDINVIGSDVAAEGRLALDSARDINVRAGHNGSMNETHSKSSGFFSGGKLFAKSEDLEGRMKQSAALSSLSGGEIALNAQKDMALQGVNVAAVEGLSGSAENITIENATDEEKRYSMHQKLEVGFGDALKAIVNPLGAIKVKDGKASITIAKAEFEKAQEVTTTTTVVSSSLQAGNIDLSAGKITEDGSEEHEENEDSRKDGNIRIKGTDMVADGDISLTAGNDVTIEDAKDTVRTETREQSGKAELKVSVKNEYVQIAYALKAVEEAKDNLKKSKQAYDQYKRDLAMQEGKLAQLKADLASGKLGIEQADIDEMQGLIDDLRQDDAFYKANMALAAADLASKTTAAISQMATAAESSGTYGFNASLDLDIDMLEKQFADYRERSVASNLAAGGNIDIKSGESATVRGSNLNARDSINIDSEDVNIVAAADVNNSSNSSDHKHVGLSVGIYGGAAGNSPNFSLDNLSGSTSADRSSGSGSGITHSNSRLNASNININADERTTIAGANIAADDTLSITTESLEVASVQDSQKSRSQSRGASLSGSVKGAVTGGGVNAGVSRTSQKETVLTTLSGNRVDIDVEKKTTLRGATIAAVDENGEDNGNLRLKTGTLEVGSLNNRRDSSSTSMGVNVGLSNSEKTNKDGGKETETSITSVGIDYANDRSNSKTKTLGTIGAGNIEVGSAEGSSTAMLNRDITDNEVDIYSVDSHRGLKGEIDTRMLTKEGRQQIAEEAKKAKVGFYDVAKDIVSSKELGLQDVFSHQGKKVAFYDGMQKALQENRNGIMDKLTDPNATVEDKNAAMRTLAVSVAHELRTEFGDVSVISSDARTAEGEKIKGAYHEDSGDIALNDPNIDSMGDMTNTLGHEMAHAVGYGEEGARIMGGSLEDYANFGMWNYGDGKQLADGNNHVGTVDDRGQTIETTDRSTQNFERRNADGELQYNLPRVIQGMSEFMAATYLTVKYGIPFAIALKMVLEPDSLGSLGVSIPETLPIDEGEVQVEGYPAGAPEIGALPPSEIDEQASQPQVNVTPVADPLPPQPGYTATESGPTIMMSEDLNWDAVISKSGERRDDHVRQHNYEDLSKPLHGVFDHDAVDTTNQAWERAKQLGLSPDEKGILNVPMGEKIGWEGGRNGTKTELDSVRIVVVPGTNKIITSFPVKGGK